jgi:hypothetical protein
MNRLIEWPGACEPKTEIAPLIHHQRHVTDLADHHVAEQADLPPKKWTGLSCIRGSRDHTAGRYSRFRVIYFRFENWSD